MSKRGSGVREFGTSYFGVRDPEAAKSDLDRFADRGLDAILLTFSERDQRYYHGTVGEIVSECHKRDFTVYLNPWGVGGVFGGEALTEFPLRHPGARQQLSDGSRVPAACFNAPSFREAIDRWIAQAAATGADVLFWDEPHWLTPSFRDSTLPSEPWSCRCPHCRRRFEETHGRSMPEELTDEVRAFRRNTIRDFLGEAVSRTTEAGPRSAVCLAPDTSPAQADGSVESVAGLAGLDVLAVTPFWDFHDRGPESFIGEWSKRITELARDNQLRSQVWLQGFDIEDSPEGLDEFRTALRTALAQDPDSLFLWGWDGCRVMSSIACGDPEAIWEVFVNAVED